MEHQIQTHTPKVLYWVVCAMSCALFACDEDEASVNAAALLTAECESADDIPAEAWVCPADRVLECGADDTVFVVNDEGTSCEGEDVVLPEDGPFAVGEHTITISDDEGNELCSAELTVVDTEPPVLEEHTVKLWPPNHKLHAIAVEDCVSVTDACDGELEAEFLWASSDEPIDDIGDGHHMPDIGVSDDGETVCVRAERQGPKDGRVYTLGVRVVDDAGNETLGECHVIVDHDQRGVTGVDSSEAYRVAFDGSDELADCGGDDGDETPSDAGDDPPPEVDAGNPPPPEVDAGTPPPEPDAGTPDSGLPPVEAPE
jgi:hypothetical protein